MHVKREVTVDDADGRPALRVVAEPDPDTGNPTVRVEAARVTLRTPRVHPDDLIDAIQTANRDVK